MKLRQPIRSLVLLGFFLRLAWAAGIDPQRYLEDIKVLTSGAMKGRATGSPELGLAAGYIEAQFRAAGLQPPPGGYRQAFPVAVSASYGQGNRLAVQDGSKRTGLTLDVDFRPLSFSSSGRASGQVVFAGYGITANEYGYDDYRGIDATGKLVLVLRHEPREHDPMSVFGGTVYTNHSQLESKALNARLHGARALILVGDRPNHPNGIEELAEFTTAVGAASTGIPFVQVKTEVAEQWLKLAGRTLDSVVKDIDRELHPRSFSLPGSLQLELATDVRQELRTVQNVMAYLPGQTDDYLIIGAHYDHVGRGEQFSMAPSTKGTVHPGADDNASGTAGVIELARWLASRPRHRRGVLLAAFAGEESGLLGSNFYAANPELPLEKAVAMINLDMIGRLRDSQVYLGGATTGSTFRKTLDAANQVARLKLETTDSGGYASSDQYSFVPKRIPFLFFFTGLHPDYHTPGDTWEKIDAQSTARLVDFVGAVAERLLDAPQRPRFVKNGR